MTAATRVLLVQGTHGWGRNDELAWWMPGSPFFAWMLANGLDPIGGDQPYIWDTDLDGVGWLARRRFKRHINWEAAGYSLYAYLANKLVPIDYVPIKDRNIIAHSHAMQVVAYACSIGLKVNRLVTIGSPVRKDMRTVYQAARPNIGQWLHVHSDRSDRIQWLGTLFDGKVGVVREQPYADVNKLIAKVSHAKLINDPERFTLWLTEGLLEFIAGGLYVRGERPGAGTPVTSGG